MEPAWYKHYAEDKADCWLDPSRGLDLVYAGFYEPDFVDGCCEWGIAVSDGIYYVLGGIREGFDRDKNGVDVLGYYDFAMLADDVFGAAEIVRADCDPGFFPDLTVEPMRTLCEEYPDLAAERFLENDQDLHAFAEFFCMDANDVRVALTAGIPVSELVG